MDDAHDPGSVRDLGKPDALLLLAIRWWVEERLAGRAALPRLRDAMARAGVADAAHSVDALMDIILRTARRKIATHVPRCAVVSVDELSLLRAAALVQAGWAEEARARLADLMAPAGARFAMGPLAGLGQIFASARLVLGVPRLIAPAWASAPVSWAIH